MSDAVLDEIAGWMTRLAEVDAASPEGPDRSDGERVELLGALEGLKAAAAAAQARVTVAYAASRREALTADGVPESRQSRSIGAEVALARRVSPRQGSRHLGLARALVEELPETMSALTAGETSEWRATLVVRETACLSRTDRTQVDAALAARPGGIGAMGDLRTATEARRAAYRLDPSAVIRRSERAAAHRCVTVRPAPDAMTYLTALLPVAAGVAAHAALSREADTARATGDPRTRGQLMADLLTTRLTGSRSASTGDTGTTGGVDGYDPARWDTAPPVPVPQPGGQSGLGAPAGTRVEVHLVMTDATLLGDDPTPGEVLGYGPIPAAVARRLVADTPEQVWVRRLYTHPDTGRLAATDSRAREFPAALRRLLVVRDEVCRTPWCDAPIRHADHVLGHAEGGPTAFHNGQGLCEACNHAKQTPGWRARPGADGTIVTTIPTGHSWISHDPGRWLPPAQQRRCRPSPGELRLEGLLGAAA